MILMMTMKVKMTQMKVIDDDYLHCLPLPFEILGNHQGGGVPHKTHPNSYLQITLMEIFAIYGNYHEAVAEEDLMELRGKGGKETTCK